MVKRRKQIEGVPEKLLNFNPDDWPNEHACVTRTPIVDGGVMLHGGRCGWVPQFCQYHKARLNHPSLDGLDVIHEDFKPGPWDEDPRFQDEVYEVWKDGQRYYLQDDLVTWISEDGEDRILLGRQTPTLRVVPGGTWINGEKVR
jgi:hypothetical protein